jgi:uncharacterized protein YbjT (DUF2867 family)
MKERRNVFIAGGTGYMGQRLIPRLLQRGHEVRALVHPGSEEKLPDGCTAVIGNALRCKQLCRVCFSGGHIRSTRGSRASSPAKSAEFRRIDLPAGLGAISAAKSAGVRHFVYVSVAHPTPTMKAYIAVRVECESALESTGLSATISSAVVCAGPGTPLAIRLASDPQSC